VLPSSSSEIAVAPAMAPTAGWSNSTPLSRTHTLIPFPVAPPSAHSRSTRSGSGFSSAMPGTASRASDQAGRSSSSSECARTSAVTRRTL